MDVVAPAAAFDEVVPALPQNVVRRGVAAQDVVAVRQVVGLDTIERIRAEKVREGIAAQCGRTRYAAFEIDAEADERLPEVS